MGFYFAEPRLYDRYKDEILALSHAVQINVHEQLPPHERQPALTDQQIADKLGLDVRVVTEIRCVAERDKYSLDEFESALEFKDNACRRYAEQGLSSVTEKYRKKSDT